MILAGFYFKKNASIWGYIETDETAICYYIPREGDSNEYTIELTEIKSIEIKLFSIIINVKHNTYKIDLNAGFNDKLRKSIKTHFIKLNEELIKS